MFSCFRVLFAMITKNLVAVSSPGRNRILHTRHIIKYSYTFVVRKYPVLHPLKCPQVESQGAKIELFWFCVNTN